MVNVTGNEFKSGIYQQKLPTVLMKINGSKSVITVGMQI